MPRYSAETVARLEKSTPSTEKVQKMLQDYLGRTQLTLKDFAFRCHYSYSALRSFSRGEYAKIADSDVMVRRAIVEFIERHPAGEISDVQGKLYETENVRLLRHYFSQALDRQRAYFVQGDPGTQKSYVLEHLVYELNRREIAKNGHGRRAYYVYCSGEMRPKQLLRAIAEACGTIATGDKQAIIRNLRFDFRTRKAVIILDEAQHLDIPCLEAVRELLDRPPHFGLLFAGSHNFGELFQKRALDLEQWNRRFHAGKTLPGIADEEAEKIIRGELGTKANARFIEALIKKSRVPHLRSKNGETYISAGRLFEALADLKEDAKAATA